ncbi:MAG: hypothetical protein ABSA11_17290 [Candidatus Bathyarchaeia archaeon]|jgi:hypothetical protein
MVDAQTIGVLITATSVTVAAIYYVTTLGEARKSRHMQFLMQTINEFRNEDAWKRYLTLMNMEWRDYDDFEKKYGSDNNPDSYAERSTNWQYYNNLGYMVSKKFIRADELFDLMGEGIIWEWQKWGGMIKEIRRRYSQPFLYAYFDFLADELIKVREARGVKTGMPDTYLKYIPEK